MRDESPAPAAAPTRRQENAAATRAALIDAGRALFTEHGYANVTTGQIVAAARVTRGALYHHFGDKRDLMRAVFAETDHALVERVRSISRAVDDPWRRMLACIDAFLDALTDETTQRIVFVEAPSALGWTEWREIDAGRSLELVVEQIQQVIDAGVIAPRDPVTLAHLILGAINEAGMLLATSRRRRRQIRTDVEYELRALVGGLRLDVPNVRS